MSPSELLSQILKAKRLELEKEPNPCLIEYYNILKKGRLKTNLVLVQEPKTCTKMGFTTAIHPPEEEKNMNLITDMPDIRLI